MSRGCLLASAESQTLYDDTEARGPALRQDEFPLVEVEVRCTVSRETQGLPTTDHLACRSALPEPLFLSFFLGHQRSRNILFPFRTTETLSALAVDLDLSTYLHESRCADAESEMARMQYVRN